MIKIPIKININASFFGVIDIEEKYINPILKISLIILILILQLLLTLL